MPTVAPPVVGAAVRQYEERIATARPTARGIVAIGVLFVLACTGCGQRFAVLPGHLHHAASAVANDIRVVATAELPVRPCECPDLRVLQVAIQNGTDGMLTVRYDDFVLRAPGERLVALAPFNLASPEPPSIPDHYSYSWSGFALAPHLAPYYRGFWGATVPVEHDPASYERGYHQIAAAAPITDAMRRHAMPEGILEPDGYITGALYFAAPRAEPSTLTARFAEPRSGREIAVLAVPLATDQ